MDSSDALSRSRYRERRLNNILHATRTDPMTVTDTEALRLALI